MPTYNYQCPECKKTEVIHCSISEMKDPECSCGVMMNRDYNTNPTKMVFINGRFDPKSCNYWKKGKSNFDIASVLAGDDSPY